MEGKKITDRITSIDQSHKKVKIASGDTVYKKCQGHSKSAKILSVLCVTSAFLYVYLNHRGFYYIKNMYIEELRKYFNI